MANARRVNASTMGSSGAQVLILSSPHPTLLILATPTVTPQSSPAYGTL